MDGSGPSLPFVQLLLCTIPTLVSVVEPADQISTSIRTQVLCEGDMLKLDCKNDSRIIVFNAWFGVMGISKLRKSLGLPPLACHQSVSSSLPMTSVFPSGSRGTSDFQSKCRVLTVTSAIVKYCEGKETCSLAADVNTLVTDPDYVTQMRSCLDEVPSRRKPFHQLKIQYTCVSKLWFKVAPALEKVEFMSDSHQPSSATGSVMPYDVRHFVMEHGLTGELKSMMQESAPAFVVVRKDAVPDETKPSDSTTSSSPPPIIFRTVISPNGSQPDVPPVDVVEKEEGGEDNATKNGKISISQSHPPFFNCTVLDGTATAAKTIEKQSIGFTNEWISAYVYMVRNLERLLLYSLVSLLGSLLALTLTLYVKRVYDSRRSSIAYTSASRSEPDSPT